MMMDITLVPSATFHDFGYTILPTSKSDVNSNQGIIEAYIGPKTNRGPSHMHFTTMISIVREEVYILFWSSCIMTPSF